MGEALEAGPVLGSESGEGFVGGGTDRDVVGVPEDSVGAERDDNARILLVEDPRHRPDDVIEPDLGDTAVRQTQPLVTVGHAAECAPGGFIFRTTNGPERFSRGRETVSNVSLLTERRVNQDEPEVRLIGVHCDAARDAVRVVVRVCEDARKSPVAGHDSTLSGAVRVRGSVRL